MAKFLPFKAVRPAKDKVSLIAARPYRAYSKKERETKMKNNPLSFLNIVNAAYEPQKEIIGNAQYEQVRDQYEKFKKEELLIQDSSPSFYLYKILKKSGKIFKGLIGVVSTEDYKNNLIKKHENTLSKREVTLKDYLKTVGFNAEPVLLTYPDNDELTETIDEITSGEMEYEFTTSSGDIHYLWKVDEPKLLHHIVDCFSEVEKFYIADGHHRSASSLLLSEDLQTENANHTGMERYNFFMAYMIPESTLRIREFDRVIKDLNGLSKEEFLKKIERYYTVENHGDDYYSTDKKHQFSMYLEGEYFTLTLRQSEYQFTDDISKLDSQVLYKTVLEPVLGIHDLRNDDRISYIPGTKDISYVKDLIDRKEFKVSFGMLPISTEDMKCIADKDLTMPPKSTCIKPKLRNGITIYEF